MQTSLMDAPIFISFPQAPSPVQKCNCQCHHYTYVDAVGVTQGNCNAADATGDAIQ